MAVRHQRLSRALGSGDVLLPPFSHGGVERIEALPRCRGREKLNTALDTSGHDIQDYAPFL